MTPNQLVYQWVCANEWRPNLKKLLRRRFAYAVSSGKIKPQPCAACGAKAEAHHLDIFRALFSVLWLCRKHHQDAHLTKGEII